LRERVLAAINASCTLDEIKSHHHHHHYHHHHHHHPTTTTESSLPTSPPSPRIYYVSSL
jgi:hypothetical protein